MRALHILRGVFLYKNTNTYQSIKRSVVIYVKLTEKQRKFAEEYLKDLNGTRAYKASYPKGRIGTIIKIDYCPMCGRELDDSV